jgi:uncharacterized membrane-anchored protein
MQLPIFISQMKDLALMQTKWAGILNPFMANPSLNNNLLTGVALANGVTVINHLLGRTPLGWRIVDINGAATVYRSAPFSKLTLTLTSSAAVTASIEVF